MATKKPAFKPFTKKPAGDNPRDSKKTEARERKAGKKT